MPIISFDKGEGAYTRSSKRAKITVAYDTEPMSNIISISGCLLKYCLMSFLTKVKNGNL